MRRTRRVTTRQGGRCELCQAPSSLAPCPRCPPGAREAAPLQPFASAASGSSGLLLEGKYRLLEEVGRGGMGTVFRAHDESLDRVVAVKFLLPELQEEPAMVERFRREARASASIEHRNVIRIYEVGVHGSTDFLVAEYLEGGTLDRHISRAQARGELVPLPEALWILEQTCAGLEAVHGAGVVHRDLKPGNLMLDADGRRVVIMDFGIGRRYAPGDVKGTLAPVGTPAYMAPEIIVGAERGLAGESAADLYSFGVTAFELLTLELPFASGSWVEILHQHIVEAPPRLSARRPDLPEALERIVLRCLEKRPEDRFGSAEDVRRALLPLLRDAIGDPAVARGRPSFRAGVRERARLA